MSSALLLVPDPASLRPALVAAGQLLAYQQRGAGMPYELLGALVRPELDADLPERLAQACTAPARALGSQPAGVSIAEVVAPGGWWALAWLDGPALRDARDATERRHVLLAALAPLDDLGPAGGFVPLFPAAEPLARIEASMHRLMALHPRLVGSRWLIDEHATSPALHRTAASRSPAPVRPWLTLVHER